MPEYFDHEDINGVKIITSPQRGLEKLKNYSRPVSTLRKLKVKIVLSKLPNYNKEYWRYKDKKNCMALVVKIPGDKIFNVISKINLERANIKEIEYCSKRIDYEGNAEIYLEKVISGSLLSPDPRMSLKLWSDLPPFSNSVMDWKTRPKYELSKISILRD